MNTAHLIFPEHIDHRHIAYPHGGLLVWIVILLEIGTFGLGVAGLVYYGSLDPDGFSAGREQLNLGYGTINTMLLLSSGYCMAVAMHQLKTKALEKCLRWMRISILGGLLFTGVKGLEYSEKLNADLGMGHDMFFTFYWLMTAFHLVHVVVGLLIIWVLYLRLSKEKPTDILDVEAGAAFWHLCDLIWLILFPALYLLF